MFGLIYFSYKYALILKFVHRAFKLCSSFELFHKDIENLKDIFSKDRSSRSLNKVCIKKRLQYKCIPVNISKF